MTAYNPNVDLDPKACQQRGVADQRGLPVPPAPRSPGSGADGRTRSQTSRRGRTRSSSTVSTATSPCTSTSGGIGSTASSGWRPSHLRGIMGSAHENSTRFGILLRTTNRPSLRHGMSTAVSVESRIAHVEVTDETITAHLVDGRVISVPLAWSWRLSEATPPQRANWRLIGDGHGIHWPDLDEDLSAAGMLNGVPARCPGPAKREGRLTGRFSRRAARNAKPSRRPVRARLAADRPIDQVDRFVTAQADRDSVWQKAIVVEDGPTIHRGMAGGVK